MGRSSSAKAGENGGPVSANPALRPCGHGSHVKGRTGSSAGGSGLTADTGVLEDPGPAVSGKVTGRKPASFAKVGRSRLEGDFRGINEAGNLSWPQPPVRSGLCLGAKAALT